MINGRNVFPQDVESAAFECDQRLRHGGGAAFSFRSGPAEQLVIALELEFRAGAIDGLFGAIAASVSAAIGISPDTVLLPSQARFLARRAAKSSAISANENSSKAHSM